MRVIAAAALSAAFLLPLSANAQDQKPVCAPAKEAIQALAKAGFKPAISVAYKGALGMFFVKPDGDWVEIAIIQDKDAACIIDGGKDWHAIPANAAPQETPKVTPPKVNPDPKGPYMDDQGDLHV